MVIWDSDNSRSAFGFHSGGKPSCPPIRNTTSRASNSAFPTSMENACESIGLPAGSRNTFRAVA